MLNNCISIRSVSALALLWFACPSVTIARQPMSAVNPSNQARTQAPIEIFSDRVGTPDAAKDVAERLRQVDAVVVGRIALSEVRTQPSPHRFEPGAHNAQALTDVPQVATESVVTIVEVIKGHLQMPSGSRVVRVRQPLGETTWNGRKVIRHDGKAKGLQVGTEYVLFLTLNPELNEFSVGADDVFRISSGHVETPSEAPYGLAVAGTPTPDFLITLRAASAQLRQSSR